MKLCSTRVRSCRICWWCSTRHILAQCSFRVIEFRVINIYVLNGIKYLQSGIKLTPKVNQLCIQFFWVSVKSVQWFMRNVNRQTIAQTSWPFRLQLQTFNEGQKKAYKTSWLNFFSSVLVKLEDFESTFQFSSWPAGCSPTSSVQIRCTPDNSINLWWRGICWPDQKLFSTVKFLAVSRSIRQELHCLFWSSSKEELKSVLSLPLCLYFFFVWMLLCLFGVHRNSSSTAWP